MERWNRVVKHGLVEGDLRGNIFFASHVFLAFVITFGGPLQLIPQVRSRFPRFHHWNGRVYLTTAFVISIGALYLVLARGTADLSGLMANILNALLIMGFAVMALRHAIKREIDIHRRWALRLFMVVGGVWFFRIMMSLWLTVNKGPLWIDVATFTGPPVTFMNFACYLLPLVLLEIYMWVQDKGNDRAKMGTALGLFVLIGAMGIGIMTTALIFWLPLM